MTKIKSKNFLARILTSFSDAEERQDGRLKPLPRITLLEENMNAGKKLSELQTTLTPKESRMDRPSTKGREGTTKDAPFRANESLVI